jgi:hypothetical protein
MPQINRGKIIRIIKNLALGVFFVILIFYLALFLRSNFATQPVTAAAIANSFDNGVEWLADNRVRLYEVKNHYLWWMIGVAAERSRDPRLADIYDGYRRLVLDSPELAANPFNILFWPAFDKKLPVTPEILRLMAPYQQYLYYSVSCSADWGSLPTVARQNDPKFCWKHQPFAPACITHQLMGYQFQRIYGCTSNRVLEPRIEELRSYIYAQMLFDPRVVDVYRQRVLMLAMTGDYEDIHESWIRRILDAQLEDGSWDLNDPLIRLNARYSWGFSGHGLAVFHPHENFHTSAQGILLMSILRNEVE